METIESMNGITIGDNIMCEGVNQTSIIFGGQGADAIRSFDSMHTIIVGYLARLSLVASTIDDHHWHLSSILASEGAGYVHKNSTAGDSVMVHMSSTLSIAHDVVIILDNGHDNVTCDGQISAIICTDPCLCMTLLALFRIRLDAFYPSPWFVFYSVIVDDAVDDNVTTKFNIQSLVDITGGDDSVTFEGRSSSRNAYIITSSGNDVISVHDIENVFVLATPGSISYTALNSSLSFFGLSFTATDIQVQSSQDFLDHRDSDQVLVHTRLSTIKSTHIIVGGYGDDQLSSLNPLRAYICGDECSLTVVETIAQLNSIENSVHGSSNDIIWFKGTTAVIIGGNGDDEITTDSTQVTVSGDNSHIKLGASGIHNISPVIFSSSDSMNDIIITQVYDYAVISGGIGDDFIGINQHAKHLSATALVIGDHSHIVFNKDEIQPTLSGVYSTSMLSLSSWSAAVKTYNDHIILNGVSSTLVQGGYGNDYIQSNATVNDYICGDECEIVTTTICTTSDTQYCSSSHSSASIPSCPLPQGTASKVPILNAPAVMVSTDISSSNSGDDTIISGGGAVTLIFGGAGDDTIHGSSSANAIFGDW
jgi:hypothetical protein